MTAWAAPGTAFADPKPTPSATASGAASAPGALEEVSRQIDDLYRQAAAATDAYNLAVEQTAQQSARIVKLAQEIVKGQEKIKALKDQAGATARMQYRNGGLPPGAQLMLSGNPDTFLDAAGSLRQGEQAAQGLMSELTKTQDDLAAYSKDATAQWKDLEANRVKKEAAKKDITEKIAAAEKIQADMQEQERQRLADLEAKKASDAQTAWLSTGVLKDVGGTGASEQGTKAVKFATDQIGKRYVWGAAGPDTFDCSGLTSQAWLAAGHPIPRTSQEQWAQLPHVAIKDMRPGDLVIYFADATHVGMYIGNGAIVHAPRPGRTVTITGAGSMPILGVVRPG
ncbi:NlpC/P60 family protein [Streptomyces sp. NPDC006704]|uniref:C40 family peptidase n=1 Tax=Streptomyces sp. NPDC006704 TaxID=3364760 RepID=UPI003689B361